MRTLEDHIDMTPGPSRLQSAPGQINAGSPGARLALSGRFALPWRALLTAALLSVALGVGVSEWLTAERSTPLPGAPAHHALTRQGLLSLPLAAQGPISQALGANSPAYRVHRTTGGFVAASPAQHLSASFSSAGVSVSAGATHLSLRLRGVGYGSSLQSIGTVSPRLRANRVIYAHAGISEWYANGPLGLEQGFTLSRAPAGHASGPLTLAMSLSGNAKASLADRGQSIVLTRAGAVVLRYGGLSATDARGHTLHSALAPRGRRIELQIDTRGARYPLRIDPFVQQGEKLTGGGGVGEGEFGIGVALSSNGNTALIGGSTDNSGIGAAWVFTRSGGVWTQQGEKLTGTGETGKGGFGQSVALSSDGNTALIGGPFDNSSTGAAWVFTRSGETWAQQGSKLTGSGEVGSAEVGSGVALSSGGNTALLGGP
jgi:trimeric autotransporter adhesin